MATVRGNLHPAGPDWWPPTKRPRASPGGLIAASVMYFPRQEAVRPCWRTSPPLGGTLGVPELPGVSCIQGMHACSWYWGSEVLGCRTFPLEIQSSAGLRMHLYPRSPGPRLAGSPAGHVLPQCPGFGHWVSYCCVVLVFGSRFCGDPAVPGRCLGCVCLGLGFGFAPPLLARVCGACVRGWVPREPRHSWLGSRMCVFEYGFWLRSAIPGWGSWCV